MICATAPHKNTAVVRPPTATSEIPLPTRSSTIFGNATAMVLNTRPALSATTTKSPKTMAATVADRATSGALEREAVCRVSSGTSQRKTTPVAMQTAPGTTKAPRQDNAAVSAAVIPAASDTPRLPQTPLNASVRPRWVALSMTMAVPTG